MKARSKRTPGTSKETTDDAPPNSGDAFAFATTEVSHVARIPEQDGGIVIELRVPGELAYRDLVTRAVDKLCSVAAVQYFGGDHARFQEFLHEMVSAVGEAFNNVVIHAYGSIADQAVTLIMRYDHDHVEVELRDDGAGFDPDAIPEPDLANLPEGGMGLYIMRAFVDEIHFTPGKPNVLTLRKYF